MGPGMLKTIPYSSAVEWKQVVTTGLKVKVMITGYLATLRGVSFISRRWSRRGARISERTAPPPTSRKRTIFFQPQETTYDGKPSKNRQQRGARPVSIATSTPIR